MLEPEPIDTLVNDIVLNEPKDIPTVEIGLYQAFRGIMSSVVVAGDMTADNLIHNGTFSQYRELGVKRITSANASVTALWQNIYQTVYMANFMLERIPEIPNVPSTIRRKSIATAHFLRGLSNFIGVTTFGGIPKVVTSNIEDNRTIPRTSEAEMLAFIEQDYLAALNNLDETSPTPATINNNVVLAALARFYLYTKNYSVAEAQANLVITSDRYDLEADYNIVATKDFTSESIFEVGYTIADDPGTLNTLFLGRREIIPSNQVILALNSRESGRRLRSIVWDSTKVRGNDHGWSVRKYGTAVEDNNNIMVFGLPEMILIRAEARAMAGKVTGENSAQSDLNLLRVRCAVNVDNDPEPDPVFIPAVSQAQMLLIIEDERRMELAFEGHRWYDLRRTGRINQVMPAFNSNWRSTFELWPIPQRELQNNAALADDQNPGY